MFLKRLTMRGFKSFADSTVVEFEPGVTAIVGPNGSGKSNVVDAVTWVLGAQSTRALRSAKMDDVIFAGTGTRAALGRAEVSLTLDNASGRLGIEGAEVTIGRTLFRNGESEYAINGAVCRLLDVQELLGDSGVGRQQHMIIGQGQLDAVLSASPENRRAIIEEAAGVLRHRRRKERAERRLAQTQENLDRLGDLVRELRRQMRPLERQAASARSFVDLERSLREARRDLYGRRGAEIAARQLVVQAADRDADLEAARLDGELLALDEASAMLTTEMASGRGEWLATMLGQVRSLSERSRGVGSVIGERTRAVATALDAAADVNVVATLEAEDARLARELASVAADEDALSPRRGALDARARDLVAQRDAIAGLEPLEAAVEGEEAALRERAAAADRVLADLAARQTRGEQRRAEAHASVEDIDVRLAAVAADLDRAREHEEAAHGSVRRDEALRDECEQDAQRARDLREEARAESARAQARAEALTRAYREVSGASGRDVLEDLTGVVGALLDVIDVDPLAVRALEAAVGASLGATIVEDPRAARAALLRLRDAHDGGLVLPGGERPIAAVALPDGGRAMRGLVRSRDGDPAVERLLDALLAGAVLVEDWEHALEMAVARPDLVVVTPEGDRFARSGWRGGTGHSAVTRSAVEQATATASASQRAAQEADARAADAEARLRVARESVESARGELSEARRRVEQLEGEATRLAERRASLAAVLTALDGEVADVVARVVEAMADKAAVEALLPEVAARVAATTRERAERAAALGELRQREDELARELEDVARQEAALGARRALIGERRRELERRLHGHAAEREIAAARRHGLEADAAALARLASVVAGTAGEVERLQRVLDTDYRAQVEAARAGAEHLESLRVTRHGLEQRVVSVREAQRRAQVELAELSARRGALDESVRRELGESLDAQPAPDEATATAQLEARVAELEAQRSALGPINPLALEELAELEERHHVLDEQVGDVRRARRELQEVVRAVDDQIMTTFSSAVADVNEHFAALVAMLFPGGQGRLILTEAEDPLNTGVEIEVRPMGRNIRRISLLSGGERSMAALAFLFAVFRSRPSPFYLMDEVEAALDDVNLQRFLSLLDEFRAEAQLLVVTHQKRTMEAADALYGVTMVPGGSSKVVSQRVTREVVA